MDNENGKTRRELGPWLLLALVAALAVGCLALLSLNAETGLVVDGQPRTYRLESAVTNYPFCPPAVPCPISMVLDHNVFAVWLVWDEQNATGVETGYRRLVTIPLP